MRIVQALAILAAGVAIGWFANEWTNTEPVTERSGRREVMTPRTYRDREVTQWPEAESGEQSRAEDPQATSTRPDAPATATPETAVAEGALTKGEDGPDPFREMIKSQGPQWKAWAAMQAKPKIEQLLAALGFDEATSALIEKAMLADVDREVEQALLMMLGEAEMDPDAFFYFMGLPPDLNEDLERELGTFLSDGEIATVRAGVRKSHEKTMTDLADMQIGMMQVPDLTDDQRTRLRDVFRGKNTMQEQFTQFAEVTRDRTLFKKLITGEIDLATEMKKNFEPQRRRISQILTPEQMKGYDRYEEQLVRQAEMGMKMMGAMLKTQDAAKKEGE